LTILRNIRKYGCLFPALALVAALLMLPAAAPAKTGDDENASADLRIAISQVARDNIPAVAHIEVSQEQEIANPMLPFENDPFFRFFFNAPNLPRRFKRELKGLGSGMIMDSQGHILTNYHVVGNATEIKVLLSNGNMYRASLVGTDPKTDLAVIKIDSREQLPHVTFGDSDKMDVGNWVVAIGHPRGLDQTVTQGIISAKHRRGITDPNSYQDFIQTDAAINPGNSGGPLLNLEGEVIAVNAAIVSQSGGFEGIGFAIPSNMALHVAKALIANGKVVRGWLGVNMQPLTPELAESFGLENTKGALISGIVKDSPAEKAGIKRGDVVTAYDGKDVIDIGSLRNDVADTPVGRTVEVTVLRKGKRMDFSVTIGNLDMTTRSVSESVRDRFGAEVRQVNDKEAQKYGLEPDQGLIIINLDPDGPLGKVGFEIGDIILEVNGRSVQGFTDLLDSSKPHDQIVLLALDHRTGQTGYVQVTVK